MNKLDKDICFHITFLCTAVIYPLLLKLDLCVTVVSCTLLLFSFMLLGYVMFNMSVTVIYLIQLKGETINHHVTYVQKKAIYLINGFVLQRSFIEGREKGRRRGAIQRQGQNKWSVSKWGQCDINTLLTELVDFNDTSNFLKSRKWKTEARALLVLLQT